MKIKSIKEIKKLAGMKVLLRADFNVPIKNGKVLEDYKIVAGLETLRFLMRYKCKVAVATHLDPGGDVMKFSTKPIAQRLEKLLGKKAVFVPTCTGEAVDLALEKLKPGEFVFLENLRFEAGEVANDAKFAKKLAKPFDFCVNNAFAVSHRDHASVSAIKKYLPTYAGLLVEQELLSLNKALAPKKPLVVVIGGAKVSTKIPIIKNFLKTADYILVGGAIANDFIKNLGYEVGKSLVAKEAKYAEAVVQLYKKAGNKKIILPLDFVVSERKDGGGKLSLKNIGEIGKNDYIYDIGPKTISFYSQLLKSANTIVWNGPMGWFENKSFKQGTMSMAHVVGARSTGQAFGVVGGGETIEALKLSKMLQYVDWVSTGGGAMLDYLAGEKMPGLKGLIK